jgi:hypothetical protein
MELEGLLPHLQAPATVQARSIQFNFRNTKQCLIVVVQEQELQHKVKDCLQASAA